MNEWDPKYYPYVSKIVFMDIVDDINVIFTLHVKSRRNTKMRTFITSETIKKHGKNDAFVKAFKEYLTKYKISPEYALSLNAALADIDWVPLVK